MKPTLVEYTVLQSREIGGVYREAGETIRLTPRQATYYLPPFGAGLEPVDGPAPTPAADGQTDAD